MERKIVILLPMAFLSLSIAQQLSLGENSDRWWFLAMPARNLSISFSNSNPKDSKPADIRDDYTYTAGVGAHKAHRRGASWNKARRICNEEGGHLAIVNSVAEANVIASLLPQNNMVYAHIGFHQFFEKDEFVTLHDQTLAKAGYTNWALGQPVSPPGENCGGMDNTGKLHDMICTDECPFVCELSV